MTKTKVPAVEGLFTMDPDEPRLIGGRGTSRESYFFPKDLAGMDPACSGDELEEVLLSRTGRIWSYTNSAYPPPLPFRVTTEPFEPITIAAVELDKERMVILGMVDDGWTVDDLSVGMPVELVLATLYEDDDHEYQVWKWRPVTGGEG